MKIDMVVTKNPSFLAYLIKAGIVSPVVECREYATPTDVRGKHVLGELPLCLSSIATSHTEIPLHLPRELVGQRLLLEDYEKYANDPVVYSVNCLRDIEVKYQERHEVEWHLDSNLHCLKLSTQEVS